MKEQTGTDPMCWAKRCRTSEHQFEQLGVFLNFWGAIWRNQNVIAHGLGRKLLREANALDPETLELLAVMDGWLESGKAKQ